MQYRDCERVFMNPIMSRTLSYLSEDMDISLKTNSTDIKCIKGMAFQDINSMLEIVGHYEAIIIMSFTAELLNVLVERFTGGEPIYDEDIDEIRRSVAEEIINIVVGNTLKSIQKDGKKINITTPITFTEDEYGYDKNNFHSMHIDTEFGMLTIGIIG